MNFLSLDIYAKRIGFFFNNQERIGSYFGLFLTALYVVASIVLFIYYLIVTLKRIEIRAYDSTLYSQEMPIIDINKEQFYFAFGLEDPVTLNRFVDETIYKAEVVFIDREKVNGEFKNTAIEELSLEKCDVANFGKNYQHLFLEGELQNSYCLKDFDYNLTFAGGFKYQRMSYIRIKIYPCKNSTDNNYHCKSQELIDRYLTSGYFSILMKDIGLNPSNYSNPALPTLQDLYTTIDRRLYKNYILNFGLAEVHTDKGLFNEKFEIKKYIQFRKEVQTFSFIDEEKYLNGTEICLIQLRLDDKIFVQKRTYTKISEILSRIGGYMQLMNTVFLLVSILINKIDSQLKIINSIFNFNLKQNKIVLKFQNLSSLNSMTVSKYNKNLILSTNTKLRNIRTSESEGNKSNMNLIMQNNSSNIIISPFSENDESKIQNIIKKKKKFITSEGTKTKAIYSSLILNPKKENNIKSANKDNIQKIVLPINDKKRNSSFKEYTENLNITMFDYMCPCHNINKKTMIGLYNLGNEFYRKRMDIVLVFSHLLITEKILLKNNCKYPYNFCKQIELLYPKT